MHLIFVGLLLFIYQAYSVNYIQCYSMNGDHLGNIQYNQNITVAYIQHKVNELSQFTPHNWQSIKITINDIYGNHAVFNNSFLYLNEYTNLNLNDVLTLTAVKQIHQM